MDSRREVGIIGGPATKDEGNRALRPVIGAPLHPGKSAQPLCRGAREIATPTGRATTATAPAIEHYSIRVLGLRRTRLALSQCRAAHEHHPLSHDAARTAVPNPTVLAASSTPPTISRAGRTSGVRPRARWIPLPGSEALDEHARPPLRGSRRPVPHPTLRNERFRTRGRYFNVGDSHVVPSSTRSTASISAARRRHVHARRRRERWGSRFAAAGPTCIETEMDLYRDRAKKSGTGGTSLDHRVHLDRGPARRPIREGRDGSTVSIQGNCSRSRVAQGSGRASRRPATASTPRESWGARGGASEQLIADD